MFRTTSISKGEGVDLFEEMKVDTERARGE